MDVWQLIDRDHANIADLIREIPYAINDPRLVGSRERLLADLIDLLDSYSVSVDASLNGPLSRERRTRSLIDELDREQASFRQQLQQLARYRQKRSSGWLDTFEDITFLVDQYLHRHVHELIPAARATLSPEEVSFATRAYVRAKTTALHRRHRKAPINGLLSSEGTLIATVAAVATGMGYLVWRSGLFERGQSTRARRGGAASRR